MNKRWIAIVGSPRRGKNTDLLVDYIIEGLQTKSIDVDKFYLDSNNLSTCKGCEACIETGSCIIQDNITLIINNMKIADGYIFASPSYNYNMTAQMKALIDRTFCLNDYHNGWKSRLSPNKKAIIAATCAGSTKESMGFTVHSMRKAISDLDIKIVDEIEYYNTKLTPVSNNENIRKIILSRITGNCKI